MRYLLTHLDDAWALTLIHLRLALIPLLLGLLIAVPLGALVQRTRLLRRITTVTASIIFTIPSLALFVALPLIIPTRILDEANVIVALTLYTTALLVRAVPEALDAVGQVRSGHCARSTPTGALLSSWTCASRIARTGTALAVRLEGTWWTSCSAGTRLGASARRSTA